MHKQVNDAKIAILTCLFELTKPKTRHRLKISKLQQYFELQTYKKETFEKMIREVKESRLIW